jgi:hypothetical protein
MSLRIVSAHRPAHRGLRRAADARPARQRGARGVDAARADRGGEHAADRRGDGARAAAGAAQVAHGRAARGASSCRFVSFINFFSNCTVVAFCFVFYCNCLLRLAKKH